MGYNEPGGYTLSVFHASSTPVDSQTYYWGNLPATLTGSPNALYHTIYIPRQGRITGVQVKASSGIATGTAEDISLYIKISNTTEYLVATTSIANIHRNFINVTLNIPVIVSDFIELKYVMPAWVTNPEGFSSAGNVYVSTV